MVQWIHQEFELSAFAYSLCACMGSFCVLRLRPNPTVQRHGEIMILQGIIIRTLSVSSMSCSGVKRKNPVGRIFQSVTINKHENNFVKLCSRFYFPAMFTEIEVIIISNFY